MSLNVAVQMDPPSTASRVTHFCYDAGGESRGTRCSIPTRTLALASGILSATGHAIRVRDEMRIISRSARRSASAAATSMSLMARIRLSTWATSPPPMLDHIHPTTLVVKTKEVRNARRNFSS